jgi:hypothetical protein
MFDLADSTYRGRRRNKTPVGKPGAGPRPPTPCQMAWKSEAVRNAVRQWLREQLAVQSIVFTIEDPAGRVREATFRRQSRTVCDRLCTVVVDPLSLDVFAAEEVIVRRPS